MTVRLVEERRFDPPRLVEVERDGHWWMGFQFAWRLCDDGHGWLAQVEFSARYDWGWGKHLDCVPPERLRLPAVHGGPFFPMIWRYIDGSADRRIAVSTYRYGNKKTYRCGDRSM